MSRTQQPPLIRSAGRLVVAPVAALAAVALLVSACGGSSKGGSGSSSAGSSSSAASVTPKVGGSITVDPAGIASTFDPAKNKLFAITDGSIMAAIYGELCYEDTTTGEVKMGFLKSLTPDPTFKVWTMVLTPGLKFSDGTPFDAASIAFNLKRDADPTSIWATNAKGLVTTVVDPTTLTVTLPSADAQFAAGVAEHFATIGSPTAIAAEGAAFATKPVGAGPFMVKSFDPGASMVVVRNPNYSLFAKDQPYLDQITFKAVADPNQQAQAVVSGDSDMGLPEGESEINLMKKGTNVTAIVASGIGGGSSLIMNTATGPFADPVARQALALSLDRTAAAASHLQPPPGAPPLTNLFAKTSPYYDAKYSFAAQDKAGAQKLFDQLSSAGKPLSFTFTGIAGYTIMETVQSQLAAYKNVTAKVKSEPAAQYIVDQRNSNYEMGLKDIVFTDPAVTLRDFFGTGGVYNTEKYSNPTVDAALAQIALTRDQAKLKEQYGIIEAALIKDNPVYFTSQISFAIVFNKKLTGVLPINEGFYPLWGALGFAP